MKNNKSIIESPLTLAILILGIILTTSYVILTMDTNKTIRERQLLKNDLEQCQRTLTSDKTDIIWVKSCSNHLKTLNTIYENNSSITAQ